MIFVDKKYVVGTSFVTSKLNSCSGIIFLITSSIFLKLQSSSYLIAFLTLYESFHSDFEDNGDSFSKRHLAGSLFLHQLVPNLLKKVWHWCMERIQMLFLKVDLLESKLSLVLELAVSLPSSKSVFILNHEFIYLIQLGPSKSVTKET